MNEKENTVVNAGFATCYDPTCPIKRTHAKLTCNFGQKSRPLDTRSLALAAEAHAVWHDQIGNLVFEDCEWKRCDFWEIATLILQKTNGSES